MQHPDEGTIHAWLDDALDGAEQHAVEQHVAACAACAATVAEARGMIAGASRIVAMLDGVRGGVIPSQAGATPTAVTSIMRSRWSLLRITPFRAAIAASLLIAAATMVTARDRSAPGGTDPAATAPVSRATDTARVMMSPPLARPAAGAEDMARRPQAALPPAVEKTAAVVAAGPPHVSTPGKSLEPVVSMKTSVPHVDTAVGTMAAAAAAPLDRSAMMDSVRGAVVGQSNAPGFAGSAQRRATQMKALQLEGVVATGAMTAVGNAFVGCYRVAGDSAAWPPALPARFSLAQSDASNGGMRNVVYAVQADGRADTVAMAGTWRQLTTTTAHVSFAAAQSQPKTVTLQLASNGTVLAEGATPGRAEPMVLARGTCRP